MKKSAHNSGFTLIELLVVISIIAMLSSIILVALNSARQKGQDAAVREEALQIRELFETERTNDYSTTYTALGGLSQQTISSGGSISAHTYIANNTKPSLCSGITTDQSLEELCAAIATNNANTGNYLIIGDSVNTATDGGIPYTGFYSIMARLPSTGDYFCIGSSGNNSDQVVSPAGTDSGLAGCESNP